MTKNYDLPPRITEGTLSDLQSKLGHAAFKRSNAKAAVIRTKAQLTTDEAALAAADANHVTLEDAYQEATTRFHNQTAEAAGDLPKKKQEPGMADVHDTVTKRADAALTDAEKAEAAKQLDGQVDATGRRTEDPQPINPGDIVKVSGSVSGTELKVDKVRADGRVDVLKADFGGAWHHFDVFRADELELVRRAEGGVIGQTIRKQFND